MEVCIASHFFYPYEGGIETQIYEMIKRLYKSQINVKVLSFIPKEDLEKVKEFPYAECVPLKVKRVFIPKFSPPPFTFFSPSEVMRKFQKECSNIKIIHSFNELIGAVIYKKRRNNVFIHSQHNAVKDGTNFILWKIACNLATNVIYKNYFKGCNKIVSISRHIA